MMYKFMTLDDGTEITHSELLENGNVKVYIEKPDEKDTFHSMNIMLPKYIISGTDGFNEDEVKKYSDIIRKTAHVIMRLAAHGGFEYAEAV